MDPRSREHPAAGVLPAIAAVAWVVTGVRMAGMDAGPGSYPADLGPYLSAWTGMMLPSLAPTAAVYAMLTRRHELSRSLLFAVGYLLVWSAVGLAAYWLCALGTSLVPGDLAWEGGGRWLAAGTLAVTALYELTPLKDACLLMCRSPLRFLRGTRRDGRSGAVATGVRAGGWCLGCSGALMAALFALGVMSLTWMALVTALVTLEKLGPWRRAATRATAAVLLALAVAVLAVPRDIPGFVIPGASSGSMHAMKAKG